MIIETSKQIKIFLDKTQFYNVSVLYKYKCILQSPNCIGHSSATISVQHWGTSE